MKKILLIPMTVAATLCGYMPRVAAQILVTPASPASPTSTTSGFYLAIPDQSILNPISESGSPGFTIPGINALFSQYGVTDIHKAMPDSRFEYMRNLYKVTTTNANFGAALHAAYPQYFPQYEELGTAQLTTNYTPSDWPLTFRWPIRPDYLEYNGARRAWGVTHGSSSTIIGVTDTYFDMNNPDFSGKVARIGPNVQPPYDPVTGAYNGTLWGHGTLVAGMAGAATDNGTEGYPSMGFNCRLDLSNNWGDDAEIYNMSQRGVRVTNGSWINQGSTNTLDIGSHFYSQGLYNDIYENGTLHFAAAGNGNAHGGANAFNYPPSYNHVFCTSNVGWEGDYGSATFNVKGVHEITIGDGVNCYNHNSRVDILAPAVRVGGLTCSPVDPTSHYMWDGGWGTSFASPQVAGTAGLMLSENSCLTPYQIEYILKKSANSSILSLPENLPYAGRIGAGALQAGITLENVHAGKISPSSPYSCNSPATQTFVITGIEINTICTPGASSNGINPKLTPMLKNGNPGYSYVWEAIAGNTTTLDAYNIAEPTIISSTGANIAYYRLTVYDGSDVQKVASKIIKVKLTTAASYDLAMRDSYTDMLDEPNQMTLVDSRDWQIWQSPDVWNRQQQDGSEEHENPEYFNANPNYAYVRVRNVGCAASPVAGLRLYWTKASTGENWKYDWDGTTQVGASNGGTISAGKEITAAGAISIPVLQPGATILLNSSWYPPKPKDFFGSPETVDVCLLARIEDSHGFTVPEGINQNVKYNISNNNNIVTRNLIVTNLDPNNIVRGGHQIDIANADAAQHIFKVQLINERSINPHFSGDLSAVAQVRLHLGPLYDRWIQGGGQGNVAEVDPETQSVLFEGGTTLELENIVMQPGERFPINIEFELKDGAEVGNNEFMVHLRQFETSSADLADQVYGNVSFLIKTTNADAAQRGVPASTPVINASADKFFLYPNPAKNELYIRYMTNEKLAASVSITDLTGRVMYRNEQQSLSSAPTAVPLNNLAPGVHFINIMGINGISEQHKFIKE